MSAGLGMTKYEILLAQCIEDDRRNGPAEGFARTRAM